MVRSSFFLTCLMLPTMAFGHGVEDHLEDAYQLSRDHQFEHAENELLMALREDPNQGHAWLNLASVSLILGNTNQATKACNKAAPLVDLIAVLACKGRIAIAERNPASLDETLALMLQSAAYVNREDEEVAWAHAVTAELAALSGKNQLADFHFERALELGQPDQVRVAYADHLIATQRSEAVFELANQKRISLALTLRKLRVARADAWEGRTARQVRDLDHEFRHALDHGDYEHAREFAYFYVYIVPNAELALLAAEQNIRLQKEPEDYALLELAKGLST